ncbi:MAG: hypothetical protein JXQ93_05325 [Flavobacteriaceae bacterium]
MKLRKRYIKIVLILLIGILFWQVGLFSRYNYITAKIDIYDESVRVIETGPPINNVDLIKYIGLNEKYGFYLINVGCVISQADINGIEIYSYQIEKYLEKRNGKNWRKKYNQEIELLIRE